MENFTPVSALLGGLLIGAAATLVFATQGRVAGVSGMCGAALAPRQDGVGWQRAFLVGLLAVGAILAPLYPALFSMQALPSLGLVGVAVLLVGFGTRLGSGCTSGHGVCGIARMSPRSIVATVTFMAAGAATVYGAGQLLSGAG